MLSMIRIPNMHAGLTRSFAKSALILSVVLIMGNLSALIDRFLHPDIPYFDDEHLIVGGISALVTVLFIIILAIYIENLRKGKMEIQALNRDLELKVEERTRQLVEAQEELVRKEKLFILGQLSESVGHELRNPLGAMSNAVYYLKSVMSGADETVKEYLNIIKSEIDNSQRIITDLLDFTRVTTPQTQATTVHELIKQSFGKCAVPEKVTLRLDVPETLPMVKVDPLQMVQVFQNLIMNGIQAMPGGGALHIAARMIQGSKVEVQGSEIPPLSPPLPRGEMGGRDFIEVSVADTGEGISPENMKKLFQPLFTTKARGIGLGLTLSKNITEANGGRIEVDSQVGKGTTFTVIVPIETDSRE